MRDLQAAGLLLMVVFSVLVGRGFEAEKLKKAQSASTTATATTTTVEGYFEVELANHLGGIGDLKLQNSCGDFIGYVKLTDIPRSFGVLRNRPDSLDGKYIRFEATLQKPPGADTATYVQAGDVEVIDSLDTPSCEDSDKITTDTDD